MQGISPFGSVLFKMVCEEKPSMSPTSFALISGLGITISNHRVSDGECIYSKYCRLPVRDFVTLTPNSLRLSVLQLVTAAVISTGRIAFMIHSRRSRLQKDIDYCGAINAISKCFAKIAQSAKISFVKRFIRFDEPVIVRFV